MWIVSSVGGSEPKGFADKEDAISYGQRRWGVGLYRIDYTITAHQRGRGGGQKRCPYCKLFHKRHDLCGHKPK